MSHGPETVVWRRQLSSIWVYLLIAAGSMLQLISLIMGFADPTRPGTRDIVGGIASFILLAGSLALFVFELARTRVRLSPEALEIRHYTTKRYAWSEITDARIDRGTDDRTIKISLADGRQVKLPAPTRGFRKPSDPTMTDAVTAIRTKAGLQPRSAPLP